MEAELRQQNEETKHWMYQQNFHLQLICFPMIGRDDRYWGNRTQMQLQLRDGQAG